MASTRSTFQDARSSSPTWTSHSGPMLLAMWADAAASPVIEPSDRSGNLVTIGWMPTPISPISSTAPRVGSPTSQRRRSETFELTVIKRINVATFYLAGAAVLGLLLILFGVHVLDKFAGETTVNTVVLFGALVVSLSALAWIVVAASMLVIVVGAWRPISTVWQKWRRRQA